MKNIRIFYLKIFIFLVVKFSVYLNRYAFVMYMWYLTAFKIAVSLSFSKWIENEIIFFYRISELMVATLIQRYDKKSLHFKNERLTEILQSVRCQILRMNISIPYTNLLNLSWIIKCLILRNMEPSMTTILVFLSYLADNKMNILYKCAGTCFITMASSMIIRWKTTFTLNQKLQLWYQVTVIDPTYHGTDLSIYSHLYIRTLSVWLWLPKKC